VKVSIKIFSFKFIVGDLAYHVKKKRAKEEFFSETEIMNWFL